MCMMLIQCFGCGNLGNRRAARNGQIPVPLDAQLALVVECVATALGEVGFARSAAQIAQIHLPLHLGARAGNDAAGAMEGQISGQGEDGEQSTTAGGGATAGQHTTGMSKEMTQEGHDIATADEGAQFPSVFTNDTLANNLANSDLGARAEGDAASGLEDQINGQGEDGEQSRTAGGGAGQHTTGTRQPPGAMSSDDLDTWTRARKPFNSTTPDQARYKPGQGLTKVKGRTSTLGTPAATAAQPTPKSVGSKRPTPDPL